MEHNVNSRAGGTSPGMEQLYRQLIKLGADVEEIKTAVRAIRRQMDAERRVANEGEAQA